MAASTQMLKDGVLVDLPRLSEQQKKLVQDNIKLAYAFMARINHAIWRDEKDDFEQELVLALMKAAVTWKPEISSFSNHANWQMKALVSNWMYHRKNLIKSVQVVESSDTSEFGNEFLEQIVDEKSSIFKTEIEILRDVLDTLPQEKRQLVKNAHNIFVDHVNLPSCHSYQEKVERKQEKECLLAEIKGLVDDYICQ